MLSRTAGIGGDNMEPEWGSREINALIDILCKPAMRDTMSIHPIQGRHDHDNSR